MVVNVDDIQISTETNDRIHRNENSKTYDDALEKEQKNSEEENFVYRDQEVIDIPAGPIILKNTESLAKL